MSRGLRYVEMNRKAAHNPLRTGPLYQHPAAVFGTSYYDGTWNQPRPAPAPVPAEAPATAAAVALDPACELRCAEALMREAVRVYDFARKQIGEANRTHTAAVVKLGQIIIPARPFTAERIRENKRLAFVQFNQRRAQLLAARRRLDAARLALGLPLADADAKLAMASVAGRA